MGKKNKNIDKKTTFFQKLTDGTAFWSFFSNIWIVAMLGFVIWAFLLKSQKNNYIEDNNRLRDSISMLSLKLEQCSEENLMAFNFINSSTYEMNDLFQKINLIQQTINTIDDDILVNQLKSQIYKLQIQANTLNSQIIEMKQTLKGHQKKGASK